MPINPDYPAYIFDPKSLQYRDKATGKYISQKVISQQLIEAQINQLSNNLLDITKNLFDGKIGLDSWEDLIAKELKNSHIAAYSIGKGGTNKLTSRDYGLIGQNLRSEYSYLRNFTLAINNGELSTAQIEQRLKLYINSIYNSYELGRTEAAISAGNRWERWIRVVSKESCDGCISQEIKKWQRIGTLPRIGTNECLSNCRCYKTYSAEIIKPTDSLLTVNFGWL